MTKQEIKEYAAAFGVVAHYRGSTTEDKPSGFFFETPLLDSLTNLEVSQTARLRTMKDSDKKIQQKLANHPTLTFDKLKEQLTSELKDTIERVQEARQMKAEFEQTKVYTTEMQKYETSTV